MIVGPAEEQRAPGFLSPAAQIEQRFSPMVADAGFRTSLEDHLRQSRALDATAAGGGLSGGLLFGPGTRAHRVHRPVVGKRARGTGAGRALVDDAIRRWVRGPATAETVAFGADHPRPRAEPAPPASASASSGETAAPGPEGGSRQAVCRRID